jgi:hypothetical protein
MATMPRRQVMSIIFSGDNATITILAILRRFFGEK